MNILFISAVPPYPLHSGGQVRIYNLLKRLAKSHKITLATFARSSADMAVGEKLPFLKETRVWFRGGRLSAPYLMSFVLTGRSLLASSYRVGSMRKELEEMLEAGTFDLIHLEPFYAYPSLPETKIPLVVGEHNVEWEVYGRFTKRAALPLRPVLALETKRIRDEEARILARASRVIVVSRDDKHTLATLAGHQRFDVVENGVDTGSFAYRERSVPSRALRFLFVGNFAWMPNIDALGALMNDIWPGLIGRFPDSTLTIAGKHIPSRYRKLDTKRIKTVESPDDIRSVYDGHDVMLSPVAIAGGSKFKILESMASGIPVVASPQSITGLSVQDGIHVRTADTSREYTAIINDLIRDPSGTVKMTRSARELVVSSYDWDILAGRVSDAWKKAKGAK